MSPKEYGHQWWKSILRGYGSSISFLLFTTIVGGYLDGTCENIKDPCTSAKCHGFSMSWPIKEHVTTTQQNQIPSVSHSLFKIFSGRIITDASLMVNCGWRITSAAPFYGPVPFSFCVPHLNFAGIPITRILES